MGASVTRICLPVFSLFLAGVVGSCANVDQFGYRASAGNSSVQDSINKEVLLNIIRASQYRSFSWNPVNQVTSGTSLGLNAGPTFSFGPINSGPSYSPTGSFMGSLNGGYTTSPLVSTNFQLGMITPITPKTVASLLTYYPREVIFYALVDSINIRIIATNETSRLVNDPAQDYLDVNNNISSFDEQQCDYIARRSNPRASLFPGTQCSYSKFRAFMQTLIEEGLSAELVEYPTTSAAQATNLSAQNSTTGASLLQTTTVAEGRFCLSDFYKAGRLPRIENAPYCGERTKPKNLGGSIVITKTETQKADDRIVNTNTNSRQVQVSTTKNTLLPLGGGDSGRFPNFEGLGPIEFSLVMRSPNGFLSYLGSWYNYGDRVPFNSYKSVLANRIFAGGPYLSITNAPTTQCYSSIEYNSQPYCVPITATHTAMLMDLAVVLRNLNVQPTDLNAPASVRLAD
jgi:hypothetical protein